MRVDLPRDLLLAVVPNTRGIAFTYFEGPLSPVDWGLKETRGAGKNGQSLAALAELITRLQPDVLILDDYTTGHPRRAPRIQRLQKLVVAHAASQAIEVVRYTRDDVRTTFAPAGAVTRYEIAELIAGQVDAFSFRLPPVRKLWMTEDRRMALFDAAALAMTHFSKRGLLPPDQFNHCDRKS